MEPRPPEVVVGKHLQDGIGPRNHTVEDGPSAGVPVSGELPPQEVQADVAPLCCTLKHDQRFHFGQAAQRMNQDVGQACHWQPRMLRVGAPAVDQRPRRCPFVPWTEVNGTRVSYRPQPVYGSGRQTGQQSVVLQRQAEHACLTRHAVDASSDPHNSSGRQCLVEGGPGKSSPAERRGPGYTRPLTKKSLNIHRSTVHLDYGKGQTRGATCGQPDRRGALRHGLAVFAARKAPRTPQCAPRRRN